MSQSDKPINHTQERIIKRILRWYSKNNVFFYRISGGRLGGKFPGSRAPVCLITMKGKKTGLWRTTPLIHIPYKDGVVLVASVGGLSKNPIWYNNLSAHPELEVQVGYDRQKMTARQATEEEKAEVWPTVCSVHPAFKDYQERTDRNIPVMICTPCEAS